jgi:hypothetical protein
MNLAATIAVQAKLVEDAQRELDAAKKRYQSVKALGGQQGYTVNIGGMEVRVASMDFNYTPKINRGCEMIHLGALKALDGAIDHWQKMLRERKQELAKLGLKLAESAGGAA